ncbi:unnamed protein product [Chondrus crispus]|uniref:Uncharacterized protein n=1 Tax=Chondrus crispus TaxID=2769 RepID=R7QNM2_CHOCR|nr:unnamed protein product [Chondrus crispus]CDF39066.1 unnamed protein product [Chondrus crispus]|eukprot:XP_005718977.1 unnamed protein product [Chondrus crispus]
MVFGPRVVICVHFSLRTRPSSGQGIKSMARERHCACTWINEDGLVRCTCIGMVDFRIKEAAGGFHYDCCCHSSSINAFLTELGMLSQTTRDICGKALHSIAVNAFQSYESYMDDLPLFTYQHGRKLAVLAMRFNSEETTIQYVPIRFIQRNGQHYICAFCDLVCTNSCEHVTKLRDLLVHGGPAVKDGACTNVKLEPLLYGPNWNPMDDLGGLSRYPVGVVDCKEAIRMNRRIVMLSQSILTFMVSAPKVCVLCNPERDESTRKLQQGIIMTTAGVCEMHVEVFKCSNCYTIIHSEGRDHKIVLASLSTAATHVLLRHIIRGVATSNGTLRGRLEHYYRTSQLVLMLI